MAEDLARIQAVGMRKHLIGSWEQVPGHGVAAELMAAPALDVDVPRVLEQALVQMADERRAALPRGQEVDAKQHIAQADACGFACAGDVVLALQQAASRVSARGEMVA